MKFLITSGPTREYIDPVRFISNASSGKMGSALAEAAARKGHKVVLVTGPAETAKLRGVKTVNVVSAKEMFAQAKKYFASADIVIGAAAVADYAPAQTYRGKLKKTGKTLALKLKPTKDILKILGKNKKNRVMAGFALETGALIFAARKKLREKNLDLIAANYPEAIGEEKSSVWLIRPSGNPVVLKNQSKNKIAERIINETVKIHDSERAG
ncbi:MAG: phosphopantothenoylcysteine decarboxylase [Elusimicrobiota bacterium]